MTSYDVQIVAASLFLSCFVLYGWWSSVRVIFLREDLFKIRDALWDAARELGAFDDPEYRWARRSLNSVIHLGDFVSVKMIDIAMRSATPTEGRAKSTRPEVSEAVDRALSEASTRIAVFILFQRGSGWLFILRRSLDQIAESVRGWVRSSGPLSPICLDAMERHAKAA
jgi:hypothetical protein